MVNAEVEKHTEAISLFCDASGLDMKSFTIAMHGWQPKYDFFGVSCDRRCRNAASKLASSSFRSLSGEMILTCNLCTRRLMVHKVR
mgnify:CR=1 FL=1